MSALSKERVMVVVEKAVRHEMDKHDNEIIQLDDWITIRQNIAVRVADELATPDADVDSASVLRARIVKLRDEWSKHADREWHGEAFVSDLDDLLAGDKP